MSKKNVLSVIIALILSLGITILTNSEDIFKNKIPTESYRVYLKGELIGLIKSEDELNNYINDKQQDLKEKYGVDKVYIPNDINVVKDITYENNLTSVSSVYNTISEKSPFTIKGYVFTIDKTKSTDYTEGTDEDPNATVEDKEKIIKINVLDKELFKNSVKKTVFSFITEEEYENVINETQNAIIDTGEIIEALYIEDYITSKEAYIPVNEKIYTNEEELTQVLLFGSDKNMSIYTVSKEDTLESVAEANKMNVNELLIANSALRSENALLYEGQQLTVGVMNPLFSMVEEKHVVSDQTISYKTEYVYDNTKMVGEQYVKTQGSNGITRVTQKVKIVNGETINALISGSEEIVRGGKRPTIVSAGNWGWPTNIPYIITSNYGWRWGRLHRGVDISGTGYGSPIYAAKPGVVVDVSYHNSFGFYVTINHQNGYYTRYEHMASLSRYVKPGDYVKMGDTIGDMGNSGASQGTHLHFEIWDGYPYRAGSNSYNPLLFY